MEAAGFSGGILIANGERVIVKEGYGFSSCENVVPNTADTVYAIGSITKMFTAAAIGQLDAEGFLNIDDPISLYFDDLPSDKVNITINQLLNHTPGLQTYHETQKLALLNTGMNRPHPQPFSLGEKGAGIKVLLPQGEGFRVRAIEVPQ